ncbi:hypothetical protein LO763_05305 [Glycomyces sp. A-F 0318]|uniref:hypothetical protein n=1 Tax=Glycomyces amatae TaxID=2881355 RepID=UPI001E3EA1BD|nr:hypothetical protein [Glycomyces amatae]MCD0443043.1 hypothetical protein [Glycomyces amatae]
MPEARPPVPPPYPPAPERMPGATTTAVVLLWIMLALGVCGGALFPVFGYLADAWTDDGLEPGLGAVIAAVSVILVAWSAARGVLAVGIRRRRAKARVGAIAVEAVGLAITAAVWFVNSALIGPVTTTTDTGAGLETTSAYAPDVTTVASSCPGVLLSIAIIVLLALPDSKRWCDR